MNLLFIADPLEGFNTTKDTTFVMMREAASRGYSLMACEPKDLMWQRGGKVTAYVREITLTGDPQNWFDAKQQAPNEIPVVLADVGAVLMRKDPPFDSEYFYATHLLEQAEREGAHVFNKPSALR
ncbi:MAG: glutathione synthase, partial [Pseudorhodobacter sp.]|nr:glutathione synthase [Rhizobacter sp.]